MKKRVALGLLLGMGLVAFFSLIGTPVSLLALLRDPLQSLWGTPKTLKTSVVDLSENIDPVEEATRRLLKPLGVARVLRWFPASSSDNQSDSSRSR